MYDNSPYGYSNQNYMYSNYGGMPPYTTSYGYSGHNAYQSGSTANMAMYAAGGAVAGAALGAGAYYMYMNRYESPEWDWMRRRRYWWYNRDETQWCLEPEPPKRLMECDECFARYDSCLRTSSCYESSGCTYVTGNNYNRDDLEGVVFAPDNVKWPISVHIYSIAGPGIVTQGIDSICPPQTKEEYDWCVEYNKINSFNPDLFVTITEMDILGDNNIDSANAIAGLWMSALLACFSIGCRP